MISMFCAARTGALRPRNMSVHNSEKIFMIGFEFYSQFMA